MLQNAGVLWILTSKCASRHSGVPFFCHFSGSRLPKWLRACVVFCTFLLTNVLRATAACHFFQIETCKIAPTMRCFVHFDLQMCFAPQRRAIFSDRDLQNGSEAEVFCTFWRTNVLRATAACEFSRSQLQKWLREMWCFVHFDLQMCFAPQRRAMFPISSQQLPPHPPL